MKTIILSAQECQKRSVKAFRQATEEHLHGVEHVELIEACGREWERRMHWAQNNGGRWNSTRYEMERQ